jgi:hypothetical protein
MKKWITAALVLAGFTATAQKIPNPEPFAKIITPEDLKAKLYVVASADMEGRETATEGQRKAAAYIESYFKALGLKPGNGNQYQLSYPVYADSLEHASVSVGDQPFRVDQDFSVVYSLNHNSTEYFSEAVYVRAAPAGASPSAGSTPPAGGATPSAGAAPPADPFAGLDVRGKLVLIDAMGPAAGGMRAIRGLLTSAQKAGAAAILLIQSNFPRGDASGTQRGNMTVNLYKKTEGPDFYMVSEQIGKAILGASFDSAKQGTLPGGGIYQANVRLEFQKSSKVLHSSDVLAVLPGTDKADEYVFVTGHYDHLGMHDGKIWFGADDDGSGTCAVLEMAKAFAKAASEGKGPRRTMVFMTVSGEEEGLWGSAYYTDHPVFPLAKTSVDLNIDMIGRIDPSRNYGDSTNYVYIIGDDKLSSDLAPITDAVNGQYTKLELDRKFNDLKDPNRFYYRSDHYNFADKGVPIIFYFNGTHADYHQPTDTPDKINYDLYARRARLVFYTAWNMANRQDLLKRDMPLK